MPSLDPLRPHLYQRYTADWTDARWTILRELAGGRNPGGQAEAAVTAALCAIDGPVGHKLAKILLDIAGQPANTDAEMIDPRQYAAPVNGRSLCPDVGVRGTATERLLVLVECKRDAHINGYCGYCPLDPDEYSSQVICYPHGCWALPGALEGTACLWVHPRDTMAWNDCWNERHLNRPRWIEFADGDPAKIRHWIEIEGTATNRWRTATWEDLVARIYDLHEPAADVIAAIIRTWLAR
jgi:hypothetical protein